MNQKGLVPLLIVIILAALVGGYLVYQKQATSTSSGQTKPTLSSQPSINSSYEISHIKIGKYEVLIKTGWEELRYIDVSKAESTNDVYEIFSKIYPSYTDKNGELYIKEIVIKNDTAEVYFGGDESALTDRMGTTGPYNYTGLVTFALTEDERIKKVDFKLKSEGTHFGPTISTRDNYIDLWPTRMLEEAASKGYEKATEVIHSRKRLSNE